MPKKNKTFSLTEDTPEKLKKLMKEYKRPSQSNVVQFVIDEAHDSLDKEVTNNETPIK